MDFDLLKFPIEILNKLDLVWTFFLLVLRFTGLFLLLPGISGGARGMMLRTPAILAISMAATFSSPTAVFPENWVGLIGQGFSEIAFGAALGIIPRMIIDGVQTAGQLSSATMGLGAAQLLDPTLGTNVSSISRILGELVVIMFLILGGHYVIIHAATGLGTNLIPGTFLFNGRALDIIISSSSNIFTIAAMVSAPVIVALLLTQFVMGLVTKAVPTVNIFIVSFPLTIGIGLVLTSLSLPELAKYIDRQFHKVEPAIVDVIESANSDTKISFLK
ncbi:MAG: flagellar biosynthetic protein FliR [Bdellovibrionales bacterium]|nr:flagellar biosynthetic protein FliR [Bdellovibrionales bacterium]